MKLTNPSDEELNKAFSEHVAKIVPCDKWSPFVAGAGSWIKIQDCQHGKEGCFPVKCPIKWTTSADAVLPWLEKWPLTEAQFCPGAGYKWAVEILEKSGMAENSRHFRATGDTSPRACVFALLLAHGVEIEFT